MTTTTTTTTANCFQSFEFFPNLFQDNSAAVIQWDITNKVPVASSYILSQ